MHSRNLRRRNRTLTRRLHTLQKLENRCLLAGDYSLQILHASDLEGGVDAIEDAPNFAAVVDALEADAANSGVPSITLSAGDNIIPGPFFNAAGDRDLRSVLQNFNQEFYSDASLTNVREGVGRVDISIMNAIGFDASAIGNHEFDAGSNTLSDLIGTDIRGTDVRWLGAQFPYLSANLDFSGDGLDGLFTDQIRPHTDFQSLPSDLVAAAAAPKIAPATLITAGTETIGVIGATTQLLEQISSPGGVTVVGPNENDMTQLASVLQPTIDSIAAGGVDKIILVSHLQQISLEQELAELLSGVDVIIAGGSDTLLADAGDTLRAGDVADGNYPVLTQSATNEPVAIVSTDGEYSYVGRLMIDFDANGVIDPTSIDENVSGVFATDDAGVVAVTGAANRDAGIAASVSATQVQNLVDAVSGVVTAKDGNILGQTDVFIEGRRSAVRTEETNMGNLTADANLAAAKQFDPTVVVSLKNGGGIRGEIGSIDGFTGELLPTGANPDAGKQAGDISQLDIENTLRFNNGLTLLTVTAEELRLLLEHGVAASDAGGNNTPGQFPQVGGLRFSFDPDEPAIQFDASANVVTPGARIRSLVLIDESGAETDVLVRDGELVGDPAREIRIVTLDFLWGRFSSSAFIGGDGYPFPAFADQVVQLGAQGIADGGSTFAAAGSEQDALAEFLLSNHNTSGGGAPFGSVEQSAASDVRIQNLARTTDTIGTPTADPSLELTHLSTFSTGVFDESAAEIVAYDPETQQIFYTNSFDNVIGVLDISDPANPIPSAPLDPIGLPSDAGGINSVAVSNGLVAAAVASANKTDNGIVIFYDTDGTFRSSVEVGALPDSLTFSPDGMTVVVANEGEPDDNESPNPAVDPKGSVSIIDVSDLRTGGFVTDFDVTTIDFTSLDGQEDALRAQGIRIFPGRSASDDLEPEYATISPDGQTAVVTLQEANAVAVIDLTTLTLTEVRPLGTKDHSVPGNGLDASNRDDTINIRPWPVQGMYMPDAITSFAAGGETYYVTANEGDSRDFDETRIKDLTLDPVAFPDAAVLQEDEALGRLKVSNLDGDTDGDGDFDQLYSYGARSFTIWSSDGEVVFDSGDQFETITADLIPDGFNATNDENDPDDRSDDKGPEPEAVTIGEFGGRTLAFIGLERVGGIMVYDVTDPQQSRFVQYLNNRDFSVDPESDLEGAGDLGVEDLKFITPDQSPNGQALVVASNEVSGTVSIFQLNEGSRGEATLRVVSTPSADDSTDLPDEIGEVPVGGTYFVEVWVRDLDSRFDGLSGGHVDLHYDTSILDATSIVNEDFDILPSGTILDGQGLVDDLGGGTFEIGRGADASWARLGFVEVVATGAGLETFTLDPGQLQFGRLGGGGNIPWRAFDLSDTATVTHVATPTLELRVLNDRSVVDADGEASQIPVSDSFVNEFETFYVEIWVDATGSPQGVGGITTSLGYETSLTSAAELIPGPGFDLIGGQINDAAGQVSDLAVGAKRVVGDDNPVLLATVRFSPGFGDDALLDPSNGSESGFDLGLQIDDASVVVSGVTAEVPGGSTPTTDLFAIPYDFDNSGRIDFGDYAHFRDAFGKPVGDPEPPFIRWADFDGSGMVDFDDFDLLEANFGLGAGDDGLVFASGFPNSVPANSLQVASTPEGESLRGTFLSSGPFHNFREATDVNNNGETSALDALRIITVLDREIATDAAFLDVNRDGEITAGDALWVINRLQQIQAEAEWVGSFVSIGKTELASTSETDDMELEVFDALASEMVPEFPSTGTISTALKSFVEQDERDEMDEPWEEASFVDSLDALSADVASLSI